MPITALARAGETVRAWLRGDARVDQLYFLFYILPDLGLTLSPLAAGVTGLAVHYATYTAEMCRAGIDNVPRGQWEAAKACNLSAARTWRHIILPQAIRPMIPALANYFLAMFKETPLLSAITVLELTNQARSIANYNYRDIEPMALVGAFFLGISLVSLAVIHLMQTHWGRISRLGTMKRDPVA